MTFAYALVTILAASYVSYACYSIVYRMTKRTPWSLAFAVIGMAAVALYSLVEGLACVASFALGYYPNIRPLMFTATIGAAVLLLLCPRIETEPSHDPRATR